MAACVTHPLDLLKVQLQTQQTTKVTLPQLISTVHKSNGIMGFYNGLSASVLRQMTYSLARFAVYESVKSSSTGGPLPFYQKILLAAGRGDSKEF